jgi:hypothetical protein
MAYNATKRSAAKTNPSIVDSLSNFYAQQTKLVKTLGGGRSNDRVGQNCQATPTGSETRGQDHLALDIFPNRVTIGIVWFHPISSVRG